MDMEATNDGEPPASLLSLSQSQGAGDDVSIRLSSYALNGQSPLPNANDTPIVANRNFRFDHFLHDNETTTAAAVSRTEQDNTDSSSVVEIEPRPKKRRTARQRSHNPENKALH